MPEPASNAARIVPASQGTRAGAVAADAPPERFAIHHAPAHIRFWIVAIAGLALDLFSKYAVFNELRQGGNVTLIPGVLEFHTTMNPGALFGIGAGRTELFLVASVVALVLVLWMFAQCPAKRWLTQIALAGILAGALGNMYDRINVRLVPYLTLTQDGGTLASYWEESPDPSGSGVLLTEYPVNGLSMRLRLSDHDAERLPEPVGYVRDFIKISQTWFGGRDVWPWVFNVADMLLVGGVGILAIRMLFERSPRKAMQVELDAGGGGT